MPYPNEGPDHRWGFFGLLRWLQWHFSREAREVPETTIGLFMALLRPFAIVVNLPWFGGRVLHFRIGGRWDDWGIIRPTFAFKVMRSALPYARWDLGRPLQ